MYKFTYSVDKASLQRGNLIFYDLTNNGKIDHVTTVLGPNLMLHPSPNTQSLLITPMTYLDGLGGTQYYRALDWNKLLP